jgi:hypothetical protein
VLVVVVAVVVVVTNLEVVFGVIVCCDELSIQDGSNPLTLSCQNMNPKTAPTKMTPNVHKRSFLIRRNFSALLSARENFDGSSIK